MELKNVVNLKVTKTTTSYSQCLVSKKSGTVGDMANIPVFKPCPRYHSILLALCVRQKFEFWNCKRQLMFCISGTIFV